MKPAASLHAALPPDSPMDTLEQREPAQREAQQTEALRRLLRHARQRAPIYAQGLEDLPEVLDFADLARLPVLRKSVLADRQTAGRQAADGPREPFGGYATIGWTGCVRGSGVRRVFQSPGGLYEPEGQGCDPWRMARALHAAGLRAGDLVHNSFAYHLTPAGAMMESGALRLGCSVFPGGVGNTELQLQAMLDLGPQAYTGTPGFLRILLERAQAQGQVLPLSKALVSGEAFPASLRDLLADQGIQAFQAYATADLGLIAYETRAREGLVIDEEVIVEVVRPGSGEPVPEGEVGEVVVTALNPDYPLIRFGTGDLSAFMPGTCPTGRSNRRLRGWLGRADQSAKVRGMFVHATQLGELSARFPELGRLRLVIDGEPGKDSMCLQLEMALVPEGLGARIEAELRELTKLRGEVVFVAPGSLPNDGRVIEDRRSPH